MEKLVILLLTITAIVASYTLIPDKTENSQQIVFGRTILPITLAYQVKPSLQPCKIRSYQMGRVTVQFREEGDTIAC